MLRRIEVAFQDDSALRARVQLRVARSRAAVRLVQLLFERECSPVANIELQLESCFVAFGLLAEALFVLWQRLQLFDASKSWRRCHRTNNASAKDRKSTRLNSSHITISYAVFCLKKKTKQKN